MKREHWITNTKTKKYVPTDSESFDGEWKNNYPHTKKADWLDVAAFSVWPHDVVNGIPFVYDLSVNGGHFLLLVDVAKHEKDDIDKAKRMLRHQRDVVSLRAIKLIKAEV